MRYFFRKTVRLFIVVSMFLTVGYTAQKASAQTVNFHSKGTVNAIRATDIRSIKFGTRITVSSTVSSSTSTFEFSAVDSITVTPATNASLAFDLTRLPFGGKGATKILIRMRGNSIPELLSLWLCGLPTDGAGANNASDWTNADGTWDYTKKPQVQGSVIWDGKFEVKLDGNGNRILTGNGLPNHPTGIFPITPGSIAFQYDRNPNIITSQPLSVIYPAIPQEAASPTCVGFGPAGYALTGSAIYHGASTLGNDASAHEMLDRFGGHTDGTSRYHYHFPSQDHQDHIHKHTSGHSALMGYMLDGFGIYGPLGEDGKVLSSKDLDECHGHKHPVLWDGKMVNLYHYHWTFDFPYNIGCYKGTPKN